MINIIENTPNNIIFDFEYIEISYRVEIDLNKNKLYLYKNMKDTSIITIGSLLIH